jgi:RHS repeat-associated protein
LTGVTSYAFDALARVTGITTPQGSVGYTYNDADQRTSMTLPGGRTISYNYDATGRLATIGDWASGVINYSFDADGNLTGLSRSNGVNSSYGYDNAGRLTNISHNGPSGNLLFTNYTLDANGNRTTMASNAGTESYTLDVLNRLTNATYPNGDTAAYSYDANGNRLSQPFNGVTTNYSYDDAGQLLSDGATTYSYDANGNLITAGADSYTWDWANRMTAATVGGNNASYAYDAFDVRVSGAVNGAATNYLWDRLAQNPTLVDDGGHAYVHGVGPQAQIDGSGNRHYLLSDALSSIRGMTDGSGALVGNTAYDAFGAVRSQTGSGSVLGYTGELYTPATGLLHLRSRDLNPALGRFLSVDTVQPNAPGSQGFNGYAYVANNPTLWVDPSGHTSTSGYFGTAQFLPLFLGVAAFALAASLATQIELTLAEGRNPQSWSFGNHTATTNLVLTTFAMVLRCALIPGCMDAVGGIGNATKEFGSDAPGGVTDWTPDALPNAWSDYPAAPPVADPAPITDPGTASPPPDPGPKGPGWFWPAAGSLALLGAWTAYQYFSPAPARDPLSGPGTDPANDPLSTPGATPTPDGNPQHRGRLQIQGRDLRQESSWPWAQSTPPNKTAALSELAILWSQLSRREQQLRTQAYTQAQSFIQRGPHYAGKPWTFQNPNLPAKNKDARIDIEIHKGMAFVD